MKLLQRVWSDQSGATAVEYGLMVGVLSLVVITAVNMTGVALWEKFNAVMGS